MRKSVHGGIWTKGANPLLRKIKLFYSEIKSCQATPEIPTIEEGKAQRWTPFFFIITFIELFFKLIMFHIFDRYGQSVFSVRGVLPITLMDLKKKTLLGRPVCICINTTVLLIYRLQKIFSEE